MKDIITFISLADVCEMHDTVIQELGGRAGLHDQGLLESAINQPLMILSLWKYRRTRNHLFSRNIFPPYYKKSSIY